MVLQDKIKKSILMLGGIEEQIVAIKKAKDMGLYVITCDNRPDNPGHKYADAYYNVSITDKDAVLQLAKKLQVDAVVCYSLEAGVEAAAYAQQQLAKPTSPYESVRILSNKILFRKFLKDNGFCVPKVYTLEDVKNPDVCIEYPVVVKPADLWGSRGFSRVDKAEELQAAIDFAMECSRFGEIIIEQFIEPMGAPIEGDGFSVNGKFTAHAWSDCIADPDAPNSTTPTMFCYPSKTPTPLLKRLDAEVQRLLELLNMQTNGYNIEVRITADGSIYLMEVAPRNGGNAHPLIVSMATGNDLIEATILAALGEDCSHIADTPCKGYWFSCILHSNTSGIFHGVEFDKDFQKKNLVSCDLYLKQGDDVLPYSGTNCSVGIVIARFDRREDMKVDYKLLIDKKN